MDFTFLDEVQKLPWDSIVPWVSFIGVNEAVNKSALKSNSIVELIFVILKKVLKHIGGATVFVASFCCALSFVGTIFFLLIIFKTTRKQK
jgi:hypothetical protein